MNVDTSLAVAVSSQAATSSMRLSVSGIRRSGPLFRTGLND
jgi:hypothetical protein